MVLIGIVLPAFTIIDTFKFKAKDGTERSNVKKLLMAKAQVFEKIKRRALSRSEAGGELRGSMFKVFRGAGDKSPAVGEDFEFIKAVDLSTYEDSAEFDYPEMFLPNPTVCERVVRRLKAESSGGSSDDFNFGHGKKEGMAEGTTDKVEY
jgi:hypothetical protein